MLWVLCIVAGWEVVSDGDTRVERRMLENGLYEMKTTSVRDISPKAVADAFWYRRAVKGVLQYTVIKHNDTEKIVYVQLEVPLIKNRDYTTRITRYADEAHGLYQFESDCNSELGPPPNDSFIRVRYCKGHVTIERDADGRTIITNVYSADPAGSIPKWLVNVAAPKASRHFIDELVKEARAMEKRR